MFCRLATLTVLLFGLSAKPVLAQSRQQPVGWEWNLEAGADFRGAIGQPGSDYPDDVLIQNVEPASPSAFVGVSLMRRISGLRALWGVRADAFAAPLSHPTEVYEGSIRNVTAGLVYRAFFLDLQGDCDCPTWGDDPWIKKALFFEAGLGVGYEAYQRTSEGAGPDQRSRVGGSYHGRLGVSHRLRRSLDVYLAAGVHGVVAENQGFQFNVYGLRPSLGITYRPGR